MIKRKMVSQTRSSSWDYVTLKIIQEQLPKLIEELGEDATIEVQDEYGVWDIVFQYQRPETDKEMKSRLESEKDQKEFRRRQYEKLKGEFE